MRKAVVSQGIQQLFSYLLLVPAAYDCKISIGGNLINKCIHQCENSKAGSGNRNHQHSNRILQKVAISPLI